MQLQPRPDAHSISINGALDCAATGSSQIPAAQRTFTRQHTQAACLGLPDVEARLEAAVAASRIEELEAAIRSAVCSMAAADPDLINLTEVIIDASKLQQLRAMTLEPANPVPLTNLIWMLSEVGSDFANL